VNHLFTAVSRHGYLLVFGILFLEAAGFPAPAALALIAAGAAVAAHILRGPLVYCNALGGMLLGDILLFVVGRYTGWALLGFICGLSLQPETCILRSAESFYKRGRISLLFAKFIPGVNSMAAPLAGSMKMKPLEFLELDAIGVSLYVLAYGSLGYVFRDFLERLTSGFQTASRALAGVLILVLLVYAVYRTVQYRRYRLSGAVPRVDVTELVRVLSLGNGEGVIVADVRSHGYYDPGAARIAGSIRIEPNRLELELEALPRDKDIYLYCT
jgi:membrane protein DedA with SNARE-associated domain